MKIVNVSNTYKPVVGGVASSVSNLVKELKKFGHETIVITTQVHWKKFSEVDVLRVPSFPDYGNVGLPISSPFDTIVKNSIKKLEPDIVHIHQPFTFCRTALNTANQMGIPTVYTYHTKYEHYRHYMPIPDSVGYNLSRYMTVIFSNHVGHVIVPSSDMKRRLLRWGVKREISVIPSGVSNGFFTKVSSNSFKTQHNIGKNKKVLLTVGRLAKEKNLYFMLQAFEQLARKNNDIILVIVGSGPYKSTLVQCIKNKKLQNRVVFTGPLQGETLIEAYCSADIFIFASRSETQGLVILEAMAFGLPTVVLDADGVKDFIINNETGFIVKRGVPIFIKACQKLLDDPSLAKRMGIKARSIAEMNTTENQALETLKVYEKLLPIKKQSIVGSPCRFLQANGEIRVVFGLLSFRTLIKLIFTICSRALKNLKNIKKEFDLYCLLK